MVAVPARRQLRRLWWLKNPEAFWNRLQPHLDRVYARRMPWHWLYLNDKGRLKSIGHDLTNLVVEAGRIDPYFVLHWALLAIIANGLLGGLIGFLVGIGAGNGE